MSIPFDVPTRFLTGLETGEIIRFGSILKDAASGQIIGHLQETGVLQSLLKAGVRFDPTGITGLAGLAQNMVVSSKLTALQTMIGSMQAVQAATLATSVVGIGVTAASTAMILHRLNGITTKMETLEATVDHLPARWREMDVLGKLGNIRTSLNRLDEPRSDAATVHRQEEERLNYLFDDLHSTTAQIVIEARIDPALLKLLLDGLSLCGAAQIKSLLWLDLKQAAQKRGTQHADQLNDLAFRIPAATLQAKFGTNDGLAEPMFAGFKEIRHRAACQPALIQDLIDYDTNGRDYIERIQHEVGEPLLFLPKAKQG